MEEDKDILGLEKPTNQLGKSKKSNYAWIIVVVLIFIAVAIYSIFLKK